MRKQWKPGPFLLPFFGLGTRLGNYQITTLLSMKNLMQQYFNWLV